MKYILCVSLILALSNAAFADEHEFTLISPELTKAEQELESAYQSLASKLNNKDLQDLKDSQSSWRESRKSQCFYTVGSTDKSKVIPCMVNGTKQRKNDLLQHGDIFSSLVLPGGTNSIKTVAAIAASRRKYCEYNIKYPQISGAGSVVAKLNNFLKNKFIPSAKEKRECEKNIADSYNGKPYTSVIMFFVKLNSQDIISLYYDASAYGDGYGAYPNNTLDAYTFNVRTGKIYASKDLFSNMPPKKLSKLFEQGLGYDMITRGEFTQGDEEANETDQTGADSDSLLKDDFDFYLDAKGLHIINIYDNHAAQAAESAIIAKDLQPYINPAGPLIIYK